MEIVVLVVAAIAGLVAGAWLGLRVGERLRRARPWRYWAWNVGALLAGMLIAFLGQVLGALWLAVVGLGLAAGCITGLKYGYGASVGVWAVHDRLVGSDRVLREDEGEGREEPTRREP